jgi:epoxyqueuosine reductase
MTETVQPGARILAHVCCAPCATYPVARLRQQGYNVTGFWYNPNIHPFAEHEKRREGLVSFAQIAALPMIWSESYADMPVFFRAVAGRERSRERCTTCYRLRLQRTAQQAQEGGYDAFTTTLLISPYQDQNLIREIGEELAKAHDIAFYFENFRRGWAERGRLAREYSLYLQRYCGCLYSEWEAETSRQARAVRGDGS